MPRRRRHIAGDTTQGEGAKPKIGVLGGGTMRGGGRGPVGVKCCAANSSLPPRRADPHAEGKTLWDKTPPRSAVFRVDPPLPSLPCSFVAPPSPLPIGDSRRTRTLGVGGEGSPREGAFAPCWVKIDGSTEFRNLPYHSLDSAHTIPLPRRMK